MWDRVPVDGQPGVGGKESKGRRGKTHTEHQKCTLDWTSLPSGVLSSVLCKCGSYCASVHPGESETLICGSSLVFSFFSESV